MTAEIISSVAEKAVCWCDGREPDSGLSEPRKARGGRGSGQRTCSRQSLLCDRSRVPIRFSAPKTHALVSQWNQYAVVYASSFRSSNLVLSLPSEALLPERLSVQTERGILHTRDDSIAGCLPTRAGTGATLRRFSLSVAPRFLWGRLIS